MSPNKSGWVKYDGKWLKPLKFLGMQYNGETNTFSAQTRKGATLAFTGVEATLLELEKELMRSNFGDPVIATGSAAGTEIGLANSDLATSLGGRSS